MSKLRKFKKGEQVIISSGAYSGYSIHCVGVVVKDFDPEVIIQEWLTIHPEQKSDYKFEEDAFTKHVLIDLGLIKETPYVEWNMGAYSRISEMWTVGETKGDY